MVCPVVTGARDPSFGRSLPAPAVDCFFFTGTDPMTQRMQRYAARMKRLIGDLMDVASIDAGKFLLKVVPDDCNSLIAEAADMFQSAASAKDISLQVEPDEGSLPADFDHERLLQVLANLITNSIK